ncbi:MAG: F0F1 ATP synthase subunit epsilon [Actinomycetes bacterium]|jgi:F-type H+-transporting ATPase subunit epsilon|nr:F0F1 ATP synthase subunit epsilon [Actinomycetota bacterium]
MPLNVELVSPVARVWSGQAQMISARTVDGDLGILSGHAPLFGVLVDGQVSIKGTDGTVTEFQVAGGFISVSNDRVSILTETAS